MLWHGDLLRKAQFHCPLRPACPPNRVPHGTPRGSPGGRTQRKGAATLRVAAPFKHSEKNYFFLETAGSKLKAAVSKKK